MAEDKNDLFEGGASHSSAAPVVADVGRAPSSPGAVSNSPYPPGTGSGVRDEKPKVTTAAGFAQSDGGNKSPPSNMSAPVDLTNKNVPGFKGPTDAGDHADAPTQNKVTALIDKHFPELHSGGVEAHQPFRNFLLELAHLI